MCFHVVTMMPNNPNDANLNSKKRHIGNDYVNIYWNESGSTFEFNKISSQFNFICVVIEPSSHGYYWIKSYRKSGIPGVFATSHFKMVSEENLAVVVRMIAHFSSQFCYVWDDIEWKFSWERRWKQLLLIKQRNEKVLEKAKAKVKSGNGRGFGGFGGGGDLDGLVFVDEEQDDDIYKELEVGSFA
ncbi:unnamed protein product [Ambrosiozyma monospora]|uniref:Unnamed protein product n=1 Tax=Ambrosiozyma monospora TaxID=43982 RepID=A0ACB5U0E1_AMBMO|nr:unnamed protein product [Ambrosiozyma monospora]